MKDKILDVSIELLRKQGLKFSVDAIAENLEISKKTVYKYFPDKQTLALALYEKYYDKSMKQVQKIRAEKTENEFYRLLALYYDAILMTRSSIYNKYMLNDAIHSFTSMKTEELWGVISADFPVSKETLQSLRLIIDGTFEKLSSESVNPDHINREDIIERLVKLL